jgi:segregation and condensation protein A
MSSPPPHAYDHQPIPAGTQPYQVHLPLFQGPLDLLLHLIEQEQLDITRVALAQVTDQYLQYLAVLRQVEVENLTDFLVVAAKLLLIKSRALLPKPPPGLSEEQEVEEDPGDQLAHQLIVYRQFKTVAQGLARRQADGLMSYVRIAPAPTPEPRLAAGELTVFDLVVAARAALAIRPPKPVVDEVVPPIAVTIGQQMARIRECVDRQGQVRFSHLASQCATRIEIVVTFMAMLELIKQDAISVRQETPFGDILIFGKAGGVAPPASLPGSPSEADTWLKD